MAEGAIMIDMATSKTEDIWGHVDTAHVDQHACPEPEIICSETLCSLLDKSRRI
jgi:hypothetical protein